MPAFRRNDLAESGSGAHYPAPYPPPNFEIPNALGISRSFTLSCSVPGILHTEPPPGKPTQQLAPVSELALQPHDLERLSVALDGSAVLRLGELTPATIASPSALVDVEAGRAESAMERLSLQPLEPAPTAALDVSLAPRHQASAPFELDFPDVMSSRDECARSN